MVSGCLIGFEIIVEGVSGTQRVGALPVSRRLYECCPDRLRGVLDAGATRLGLSDSDELAAIVSPKQRQTRSRFHFAGTRAFSSSNQFCTRTIRADGGDRSAALLSLITRNR